MSNYDDFDLDENNDVGFDDDDDEFFDCAMLPDGQCMKAGSEECDWECPIMARQIRKEAQESTKDKAKRELGVSNEDFL